jgi:septal ring factor EnvC (AmiA/AmiB activator)
MTDDTDLIARLRQPIIATAYERGHIMNMELGERLIRERGDAADAIEAQARRIAELEDKLADEEYVSKDTNEMFHEVRDDLQVSLHVNDQLRARIAELEATIRKFQLVEKALNYFLEKDTPHTWRYGRNEAEELARAALEK